MIEIIAAIVGAVAGGLIAWILAKKKPSYVICEEEFSEDLILDLPETRFLFRDEPIDSLHITRLNFMNMGTNVLKKPVFTVNIEKSGKIIGALHTFKPERGKSENLLCQIKTEDNTLKITPSTLYPHELNQEILSINIFTEEKTPIIAALGNGINNDGTGWSVRFRKRWVELPLLNVYAPTNPLFRFLGLSLYTALIISVFVLIGYLAWHTSQGLITVNMQYLASMQNSAVFWIIIVVSTLVILISLGIGLYDEVPFPIPLPFKRILWIQFRRRRNRDRRNTIV